MSNCLSKIQRAHSILLQTLESHIATHTLNLHGCFLKIVFLNGRILYVTYNDHSEYSYQYIYSFNKLDRERFDNYDKKWPVSTQPHHFHVRNSTDVTDSEMTGKVDKDMALLVYFIQKRL